VLRTLSVYKRLKSLQKLRTVTLDASEKKSIH
jgi:hypothetical protein